MNKKLNIYECGPRDGWQNIQDYIPVEEKQKIIDGLVAARIKAIECTSFVSPKAIPQMIDSAEIAKYCVEKYPDVELWALAPNFRGVQNGYEAGIRNFCIVVSCSESHNMANVRRTHKQSLEELSKIFETFSDIDVQIGYATCLGCPFEGIPETKSVVDFAKQLYKVGVRTISIADTIGIAVPNQVREVITALQNALPEIKYHIHIHDTRGMGIVNTLTAVECGIDNIQSTLGGLGGCPFAPGAAGNTSTEDLVYMFNHMGYDTGVSFDKLVELAKYQKSVIPNGIFSGHQQNISTKSVCTGL